VSLLKALLDRLDHEVVEEWPRQEPISVYAPPPMADWPRRIESVQADAIEGEFRELIHGLDLIDGCGMPSCTSCGRGIYLN
jgi:hypothetical protein